MDDAMFRLISAFASGLVMAVWTVIIVHWMFDDVIEVKHGLIALGASIFMMHYAIFPPHPWVQYGIFVVILATAAFFPLAIKYVASQENLVIDLRPIERASASLASRPDNVQAQFEVASWLAKNGLLAPAIAIAERAFKELPEERDPISNSSVRDKYRAELRELGRWKEQKVKKIRSLKCLACNHENPIHAILCQRCKMPHLAQQARLRLTMGAAYGRVLVGWTVTAAMITTSAAAAYADPANRWWKVAAVIAIGSALLIFTFRKRTLLR